MNIFAVFDTNVLVSAIMSHNLNSSTVNVVKHIPKSPIVVTPAELLEILTNL